MKKIKSVSELPDWFKSSSYKKQLSNIDWYKSIYDRAGMGVLLWSRLDFPLKEDVRTRMIACLADRPSQFYAIDFCPLTDTRPVHDLTVGEALHLQSMLNKDEDLAHIGKMHDNHISLYNKYAKEFFETYDRPELKRSHDDIKEDLDALDRIDLEYSRILRKYEKGIRNAHGAEKLDDPTGMHHKGCWQAAVYIMALAGRIKHVAGETCRPVRHKPRTGGVHTP